MWGGVGSKTTHITTIDPGNSKLIDTTAVTARRSLLVDGIHVEVITARDTFRLKPVTQKLPVRKVAREDFMVFANGSVAITLEWDDAARTYEAHALPMIVERLRRLS